MPGFIIPPGTVAYNAPIGPYPSPLRQTPNPTQNTVSPVGDQAVPLSINWASPNPQQVNLGNQNFQAPFGVIQALYVDNLNCGVEVQFLFADTGFRLSVPAGGTGLYPVVSISNAFYVVPGVGVGADDVTDFVAFNFLPPPVAIQQAFFSEVGYAAPPILATAPSATTLIASPRNGTLQTVSIQFSGGLGGAAPGSAELILVDGNGQQICEIEVYINTATYAPPVLLFSQSDFNVRFQNGLGAIVTTGGTAFVAGAFSISLTLH